MPLHILIENAFNQQEAQLEQVKRIIETQVKEFKNKLEKLEQEIKLKENEFQALV